MSETGWQRLRRGALWFLFAAVLLIPKTLAMRRRPREWNSFRLCVGLTGAAIAAAGAGGFGATEFGPTVTGHEHPWAILAGSALVILALIILPERPTPSVDARTRELGALVVVHGGSYRASGAWTETLLFVGSQRLSLQDTSLRPLLEIPIAQITAALAAPAENGWKLRLTWLNSCADLFFSGPFAEHFARVAESTVRSQLPNVLPILQ